MALIIEDGSGVANADSLATVAECRAYADSRGLDLPAADADVEILLRQGMDYMNSIESKYQGYRTHTDQVLCFPRNDIYYFELSVDGVITTPMKNGQCQLAADSNTNNLLAPGDGREVIEKKTGPLTTKWNPNGSTAPQYSPTAALSILEPFFKAGVNNGINLLSYR